MSKYTIIMANSNNGKIKKKKNAFIKIIGLL